MQLLDDHISINGNIFKFSTIDSDDISVICAGYIITPNGRFINIMDSDCHSSVFSDYLNMYLENNSPSYYEIFDAVALLTKHNHVVYFGIKPEDNAQVYSTLGNSNGFGVFIFPESFDLMSDQAKDSCSQLISSNCSIFGDYEKIPLTFEQINNSSPLAKQMVLELLKTKKNSSHY